jgi:demethylmenaquinone methyltransferase/2-methoxy-6-polyprenyl-1,4-benzoquinol methylase
MTQIENKSRGPSQTPAMERAIPMAMHRIGSWEILISRRPLSTTDLARRYDAISGRWERTARRPGSYAGFLSTAFWARRPQ